VDEAILVFSLSLGNEVETSQTGAEAEWEQVATLEPGRAKSFPALCLIVPVLFSTYILGGPKKTKQLRYQLNHE